MKSDNHAQATRLHRNGRDKMSNGRLLPPSVDMRSATGRRFRHLVQSYVSELGGDLSEAELGLVRQTVGLQIRSEQMQAAIVRGEHVNNDELVRISSTAKRLLETIRSKAEKRKPTAPTILDLAAELAAEVDAS
jgi:hypothetical protein